MKINAYKMLPPFLVEAMKNFDKERNLAVFDDEGRKYIIEDVFPDRILENFDCEIIGLPKNFFPVCTFRKSKSFLVCDASENRVLVAKPNKSFLQLHINPEELARFLNGEKQTQYILRNKQAHMSAVAEYMFRNAERFGLDPYEMYTLGLLHDIGYLYGSFGHAKAGGTLLINQGYKYAMEIAYHGKFQDEYDSPALRLLNEADLMIDSNGNNVGFDGRLKDIGNRYGFQSENYIWSSRLVEKIRKESEEKIMAKDAIKKVTITEYDSFLVVDYASGKREAYEGIKLAPKKVTDWMENNKVETRSCFWQEA